MTCAMPLIWISVSVTVDLPATGQPLGRGRFLPLSERFDSDDDYVSGKVLLPTLLPIFSLWPRRLNMARAHFSIARLWSFVSPCGLSAPSNSSRTPPSRPRAEPRSRASACEPREFRSISRARPFLSRGSNQLVALRLRQPVGANQFHALGSSRPLDGFMVLPRQTAFGASIGQAANKFCRGS